MKTIITFFIIFCTLTVQAQEWRKYHLSDLGFSSTLIWEDYGTGRHFRINPYDNSLWMARRYTIQTLSMDGTSTYFNLFNTPLFQSSSEWTTFEFLPGKVYALDEYYGLFIYENDTWSNSYATSVFTPGITIDRDSLYILRKNQSFVKWFNGSSEILYNSGTARRIVAKNNRFCNQSAEYRIAEEFFKIHF